MFNFFKKNVEGKIDAAKSGYEEEERKTPKAGYLLLLAMFMAALFFGWRALDDLQDVPEKPEALSHCADPFLLYQWEDWGRYRRLNYPAYAPPHPLKEPGFSDFGKPEEPPCQFSSYEARHKIPEVFEKRRALERDLQEVDRELRRINAGLLAEERQYNLALQEKIADEKRIYSIPAIQQKIENLNKERAGLETRRDEVERNLKPLDDELRMRYRDLMREYRVAWRWYEFKVFLLEVIFVVPFFLFIFWMYRRLLARNSPYTIIFTALIGVASVLLLRMLLVWFWSLFLARIIQTIWNIIESFALLKSLVFYGGMLFSIALFGGAVYLLQKRIFDPRRVAIRRLRQKQCPNCQASLDLGADYCPNCGRKLKEKCPSCGKEKWIDLEFCQYCRAQKQQ